MANPNPNIYGQPETWQYINKGLPFVGNGTVARRTSKPKMATWNGASLLYDGYLANKTPVGQMIDLTISPCGQLPSVSMFGKIALFRNEKNAVQNIIPRYIIEQSAPVNWFFAGVNRPSTVYAFNHEKNYSDSDLRWKPNTTCSTNNSNAWISILTYWQIKSLLLAIEVATIESYGNNGVPVVSWRTLDAWKTSHNTKKICDIRCWVCGITSEDDTHIQYYTYPDNPNFNYFIVSPLITTKNAWDGQEIIDYTTYNAPSTNCAFYIIGALLYGNGYNTTNTYSMCCYDMFDNQTYHSHSNATDTERGWTLWSEIPYSDRTYNKILSVVSTFGCAFTPSSKRDFPTIFTDSDLYIPIIDTEGIARGEYTHGTANSDNPLFYKNSIRDIDYDPSAQTDTNTYSSQTYFNPVLNLSSMCKRYVLNDAAVEQLCRDLWKISDDLIHTDPNEDFKDYDQLMLDNFLVNSPIDVIVSLDKYPISDIPTGTTAEAIKYGKASGAALGKPLNVNTIFFNFAGVDIYPKFGRSFLDYSPYTTYELYIPFCGVIQIDAGDIMDHTLSVQMVMDLSTGAVTAYVMADNLCIETANGSAALNIPVSGIDSITLNAQINNALINAKSAQMQARSTGTLAGRIGGGLKSVKESLNPKTATMQKATDTWAANLADYELTHQQLNPHKIGSASAACSWSLELTCRLMIYYPEGDAIDSSGGVSATSPKLADLTLYGHTTGFSCISSGAVSNYHGYTIGNIDTSSISGATEQERDMIKSLFARGVYLP